MKRRTRHPLFGPDDANASPTQVCISLMNHARSTTPELGLLWGGELRCQANCPAMGSSMLNLGVSEIARSTEESCDGQTSIAINMQNPEPERLPIKLTNEDATTRRTRKITSPVAPRDPRRIDSYSSRQQKLVRASVPYRNSKYNPRIPNTYTTTLFPIGLRAQAVSCRETDCHAPARSMATAPRLTSSRLPKLQHRDQTRTSAKARARPRVGW